MAGLFGNCGSSSEEESSSSEEEAVLEQKATLRQILLKFWEAVRPEIPKKTFDATTFVETYVKQSNLVLYSPKRQTRTRKKRRRSSTSPARPPSTTPTPCDLDIPCTLADTAFDSSPTGDCAVVDEGFGLEHIDLGHIDMDVDGWLDAVDAGKDTQKEKYAESVEQVIKWMHLGQNRQSTPLAKYGDSHNSIPANQKEFMTHHDRLRGHARTHRLPMPAVQLTHVVDFAMSFGDVSAKLFSDLDIKRADYFVNGKTPRYLLAVNPKSMWKTMYKTVFPEQDHSDYVDNQWRRGWIAIFNFVSTFPCLKLLRYAPLENIVTVANTLHTMIKEIDNGLDHTATNEDVKMVLDRYRHGCDSDADL